MSAVGGRWVGGLSVCWVAGGVLMTVLVVFCFEILLGAVLVLVLCAVRARFIDALSKKFNISRFLAR